MKIHKALLLSAVALLASAAVVSPVSALDKTTYKSKIWMIYVAEISPGVDDFEGQVTSQKPGCVEKRKVNVYREKSGDDELIGSSKSGDEGFWFVHVPPARDGTYYAMVNKRNIGSRQHKRICKAAVSAPVEVPGTSG